jgi:hypothetical protein
MINQILFLDLVARDLRWKHQQDRVLSNLKTPSSWWFGPYITAALGAFCGLRLSFPTSVAHHIRKSLVCKNLYRTVKHVSGRVLRTFNLLMAHYALPKHLTRHPFFQTSVTSPLHRSLMESPLSSLPSSEDEQDLLTYLQKSTCLDLGYESLIY